MGPSILAAAVTTMAGAAIMMFCLITFFTKFAMVLFFTIVQSCLGAFVFFLALTDSIGPTQPTYLVDALVERCFGSEEDSVGEAVGDVQEQKHACEDDDYPKSRAVVNGHVYERTVSC